MRCRSERRAAAGDRVDSRLGALAGLAAFGLGLLAAGAGCDLITEPFNTNDFSGDPYPIDIKLDNGAVLLSTRESVGEKASLLDVLAPFSIIDSGKASAPVSVRSRSLLLLSEPPASPGQLVARARLSGSIIELHPCEGDLVCEVGADGNVSPVQVTVGADLLAGDALRLSLAQKQLFLFPDIAGSDAERARVCDAVFSGPFRGGGTLLIGGTELPFVGRRIAIPTCAKPVPLVPPPPDPPPGGIPRQRGVDLLLMMSTSVGITLLSESAYERYRIYAGGAPSAALPAGSVTLVSGTIEGRRASLASLALVGKSTERGACGDVFAHRFLTESEECTPNTPGCPCTRLPCGAPAVMELPEAVEVLIIPDSTPLLAGLRVELHPDEAEVDGVLGTDVLRRMTLDIDYPNNRVLMRCSPGPEDDATCVARPELPNNTELDYRCRVNACLPAIPENASLAEICANR